MFGIVLALVVLLSACSSAQPMGPDAARALIEESAAADLEGAVNQSHGSYPTASNNCCGAIPTVRPVGE